MTPVRATLTALRRLVVAVVSGLVITGAALVLVWLLAGDWIARELSHFANERFFSDRTTRLHVDRISGSVFSEMVFEGVRLERQVGTQWHSGVSADRLVARYDLPGLLRGKARLSQVRVDNPVIELATDAGGRIILPIGRAPGAVEGGRLKELTLDQVEIDNGLFRFIGQKQGYEARHLTARASLKVEGSRLELELLDGRFDMLEPFGRIEQAAGHLTIDGRKIEARDVKLAWSEAEVDGHLRWDPADGLAGLNVAGRFQHLPLRRIKGFVETRLLPDAGEASGRLTMHGTPRQFDFEAALAGTYGTVPVDTLVVNGRREGPAIRVDSLRLRMPQYDVTDARGRFDLSGGGRIEAHAAFEHVQVDSIPIKSVRWIKGAARGQLDIALSGFRHPADDIDLDLTVDFTGDSAFQVPVQQLAGRVRYHEGSDVLISDFQWQLPDGGRIDGSGFVHPGDQLDIDFRVDAPDWSRFRPVIVIPNLAGRGQAAGRLIGTATRPEVDVAGSFRNARAWDLAADSLTISRHAGRFLPDQEFTGTLEARGLLGFGRHIERVNLDYTWKLPRLGLVALHAVNRDTTLEGDGYVDFDIPRNASRTVLNPGSLTIGSLTWTPETPVILNGAGLQFDLPPVGFRSPAGRAVIGGHFDNRLHTMDVAIRRIDLDLLAMSAGEAPPEFKGGRLLGDLDLRGPVAAPDPSGRLLFRDYRWAGGVIDSAFAEFECRGPHVEVVRGWAVAGSGRLTARGPIDLPAGAWDTWNRWRLKDPIAWGQVRADGFEAVGDDLDLARWAAFNPKLTAVYGRAGGRALLSGALSAPDLSVQLHCRDLVQENYQVDDLVVAGRYRPDLFEIDSLRVIRSGAEARLSGSVPARYAIFPYELQVLERPVDLQVDLTRADLSLIPPARFGLDEAAGAVVGRVRVRGTPKHYQLQGDLKIDGGRLRLAGREEVIGEIQADVRCESTTVRLVSFAARQGKEGRIRGEGSFDLSPESTRPGRLHFDLQQFTAQQSGDYAVRFDGAFDVTLPRMPDGRFRPFTTGKVTVDRAEIIREFDQPAPPPAPDQAFDYAIEVDAPRGIVIQNSTVSMELGGDLSIRRTPDQNEVVGELTILKGDYTVLLRSFKITEGSLRFSRVDVIDPDIDITAETTDPEYIITIHITGQASSPQLEFSARRPNESEPAPLTKQQILNRLAPGSLLAQGLTTGSTTEANQAGLNVLANSAQLLFSQLQGDLARMLGVDALRYDVPQPEVPGQDASLGRLSIIKDVTPGVTVSYSQELGAPEQGVSVEYRLGRLLYLRGEVNRRRASGLREEYNLDLRFWYDY